jgi:hypothetical protein
MGRMQASEMARLMGSSDTALLWHLQSNHYPPVPATMLEPCKAAIAAAREENYDALIPLPVGVTWKGKAAAPAAAIIEAHHLDEFVNVDREEE